MLSCIRWMRFIGLAVIVGSAIGCKEAKYPVKGNITFEGKALAGGGSVAFIPLGDRPGLAAGGEISAADGTFQLMTSKPGDGAQVGEYRVVIQQVTEQEPKNVGDEGKKGGAPISIVPLAERIPATYSDHQNSPLRAKVEAKTPNVINFDLKR